MSKKLAAALLPLLLSGCVGIRPPDHFIGTKESISAWQDAVRHQYSDYTGSDWLSSPEKNVTTRRKVATLLPGAFSSELAAEYRDEFTVLGLAPGVDGKDADRNPYLGIALSGGGPRSASFSIGVLKALFEEKSDPGGPSYLSRAHYLSTVSGGGYAAYWYFNQSLDVENWQTPDTPPYTPFVDCPFFDNARPDDRNDRQCQDASDQRYRHQAHLREHTHLLFKDETSVLSHNLQLGLKSYAGLGSLFYPITGFQALLPAFITAIPHHFANTLFDWSWNNSVFQDTYRSGIQRMYGKLEAVSSPTGNLYFSAPCDNKAVLAGAELGKSSCLKFEDINKRTTAYWSKDRSNKAQPFPIWIINTSGFAGNSIWSTGHDKELEKHHYEFTPYGYGSGMFGYFSRGVLKYGNKGPGASTVYPEEIDPLDTVNASGAAIDAFGLSSRNMEWAARFAAHMANFSLGIQLSNPVFGEKNRTHHRLLPVPFYYIDGKRDSADAPKIYLTDGGHTDNLGLFALVRRGVRKILVFDATLDEKGRFHDLGNTCDRLGELGVEVEFNDDDEKPVLACRDLRINTTSNGGRHVFLGTYGVNKEKIGEIAYVKLSMPAASQCAATVDEAVNRSLDDPLSVTVPCSVQAELKENPDEHFPHISTTTSALAMKPLQFVALRDLGEYLTLHGIRSGPLKSFLSGTVSNEPGSK